MIQSYGGFIMIVKGEIVAASKNIEKCLNVDLRSLLRQQVATAAPNLDRMIKKLLLKSAPPCVAFDKFGGWVVRVRQENDETLYLEFFPDEFHSVDIDNFEAEIDRLRHKFHYPAKERKAFFKDVCHIFQKYLGFDQVFVQILHGEDFMEVLAEVNNGEIEPVEGLLFSSKEIPIQARALYLRQLVRFKQDALSEPTEISGRNQTTIDLTHSLLREPSKYVTVYLQNIKASTMLTFSVLSENRLIALFTLHNKDPLILDPRIFDRLVGVVRSVEHELIRIDVLLKKDAESRLWELLNQDFPLRRADAFIQLVSLADLQTSLEHCGSVVMQRGAILSVRGDCPTADQLKILAEKILKSETRTAATSSLSEDYGLSPAETGEIAGVLSIEIENLSVFFFRKAFPSEITWRVAQAEGYEEGTDLPRFTPSGSFKFWVDEFRNRSRPWSEKDMVFAKAISTWIEKDFEF
jgi:light-regulated signal transduction histidine kinase (bacteriophytochrome)